MSQLFRHTWPGFRPTVRQKDKETERIERRERERIEDRCMKSLVKNCTYPDTAEDKCTECVCV